MCTLKQLTDYPKANSKAHKSQVAFCRTIQDLIHAVLTAHSLHGVCDKQFVVHLGGSSCQGSQHGADESAAEAG